MLTLEHVAEDAASVDVARRAVQAASAKPATLMHRRWCSQGECPVASINVQALDGKVHTAVPTMLSQHQPANVIGVPVTYRDGVAAAKFVSSVKEWTCVSLARAVTAREPDALDWVVQCFTTRAKGIGPH